MTLSDLLGGLDSLVTGSDSPFFNSSNETLIIPPSTRGGCSVRILVGDVSLRELFITGPSVTFSSGASTWRVFCAAAYFLDSLLELLFLRELIFL